jgi:hypothetical protein
MPFFRPRRLRFVIVWRSGSRLWDFLPQSLRSGRNDPSPDSEPVQKQCRMQDFRDPRAALFGIPSVFTKCPDMKRDAEGSESSCSECDIGPRGGKSHSEVLTGATRSARHKRGNAV